MRSLLAIVGLGVIAGHVLARPLYPAPEIDLSLFSTAPVDTVLTAAVAPLGMFDRFDDPFFQMISSLTVRQLQVRFVVIGDADVNVQVQQEVLVAVFGSRGITAVATVSHVRREELSSFDAGQDHPSEALVRTLDSLSEEGCINIFVVPELTNSKTPRYPDPRGVAFPDLIPGKAIAFVGPGAAADSSVHEAGHLLGEPHSDDPSNLMAEGSIRKLPSTAEDALSGAYDNLTREQLRRMRGSHLIRVESRPSAEAQFLKLFSPTSILLGGEMMIGPATPPLFLDGGVRVTNTFTTTSVNLELQTVPEPRTSRVCILLIGFMALVGVRRRPYGRRGLKHFRRRETDMDRVVSWLILGSLLTIAPQCRALALAYPQRVPDSPAPPPLSQPYHSSDGRFEFVVSAVGGTWKHKKCTGTLYGPGPHGLRKFWQKQLPHVYRPLLVHVSDNGYTITLDDWERVKSPRAIVVYDPLGNMVVQHSFEQILRTIKLDETPVVKQATTGLWITGEPHFSKPQTELYVPVADRILEIRLQDGRIKLR